MDTTNPQPNPSETPAAEKKIYGKKPRQHKPKQDKPKGPSDRQPQGYLDLLHYYGSTLFPY